MKKSLAILSAAIIILSIGLTACGKPDNKISDSSGNTHVIVTDEDGNMKQDPWGNLYESITDADGNSVTQAYGFPTIVTNKSNSVIENAVLTVKVPKHWKTSGSASLFRLRHTGECVKVGEEPCQIDFTYRSDLTAEETYNRYITKTENMNTLGLGADEIKKYETTLSGEKAKAASYTVSAEDTSVYYFCIEKGESIIEITAYVYEKCYDKDTIEELLNSCCTFKDLGKYTTTQAAVTTAE